MTGETRGRAGAFAIAILLSSCTTSGRQWVREGHGARDADFDAPLGARYLALPAPPEAAAESGGGPGHRLNRVVTLGESRTPDASRESDPTAAAAEPAPARSLAEPQYYGPPAYWIGGFPPPLIGVPQGRGRGGRSGGGTPAGAVHPGQDWPAPRDAGPAFPFRSGPASPWRPAQ